MTFDALAAGPEDGRLVLLLHGFPVTSWSFHRQVTALAEAGYRAVAPDQRGYSPDARPAAVEAYAVDHLIADVLAIADHFGAHQFDLVGHDWGGGVAWVTAGRHGHRLRTMTSLSTPHPGALASAFTSEDSDQASRSSYMAIFRQEGVAEEALLADDAQRLRVLYLASGMPPEDAEVYLRVLSERAALVAGLNWYRANDIASMEMGPVTTPVLYIWSTEDAALGREAAEATAALVDGPYRFEVLEGVTHWIPELATERVTGLLLDHLAAHG